MKYARDEIYVWSSQDDLDTMYNAEEMLDSEGIDPFEEGFIRGYMAS